MAKIEGTETTLELLVNCKTYPAVSTKYIETVCTGGVQPSGEFVRLYPIQYRILDAQEKYKRWDVIQVRAYRDSKDTRPESWHLAQGSEIKILKSIGSDRQRWDWMRKSVFDSTSQMDELNKTNGCVEIEPLKLYYEPDKFEWTEKQKAAILQMNFFMDEDARKEIEQRVPFQFRLKYREKKSGREGDGKVLAWSYYTGYLRNKADGDSDEVALDKVAKKVRDSIFNPEKTVFAIFGTHSRYGTWMISALYHLPTKVINNEQMMLL